MEYDSAIGIYYDQARDYDPKTGRFLQQDPLGLAAGDINDCRYVDNDPASLADPSGMAPPLGPAEKWKPNASAPPAPSDEAQTDDCCCCCCNDTPYASAPASPSNASQLPAAAVGAPPSVLGEAGLGAAQGGANLLNSVTDAGIGTVNLIPLAWNYTVGLLPGAPTAGYIPPWEWSQGLVTLNDAPIEDPETHSHSRFFSGIAVAAATAPLGPKIPFGKIPLPGPAAQLVTNAGAGMILTTAGELSLGAAPVGVLGSLGSLNQMTAANPPGGGVPRRTGPLYKKPSQVVKGRVNQLKCQIPGAQKGRITMSVAVVEDADGARSVLVSTSEPGGYLRPRVTLKRGESLVPGAGHAEENIIAYASDNKLKVIDIGATKPVCVRCQDAINPT